MSESKERLSSEPKKERKEKFEDFELKIGDRLYDDSDEYLQVKKIEYDDSRGGGGYLLVERIVPNEEPITKNISFRTLLGLQDGIDHIDRADLPENIEIKKGLLTRRQQTLLKKMEKIEAEIRDPKTPFRLHSELLNTRADIVWQMKDELSPEGGESTA